MARYRSIALLLFAAILPAAASAQDAPPRVLILGDSIYRQLTGEVAKALKGKAEIVFATMESGEVRNTTHALASLDEWLGEGKWDLIHFNFGLGDLVYRAPGMKSFRAMPKKAGGVRATDPALYEKNLRELVRRFEATGAKLVWASTTPIRNAPRDVFEKGSEIEYNAIAGKVMSDHKVPINDMYAYVKELIDMDRPTGQDPFTFDKKPRHPPVVDAILENLP